MAEDKRLRIVNVRRNHRLPYVAIVQRVGVSSATVGRICAQEGVAKQSPLGEALVKRRYERKTPGERLHLGTKKLARLDRPDHRVTGDVRTPSRKPGYHALHVASTIIRVWVSPAPARPTHQERDGIRCDGLALPQGAGGRRWRAS